MKVSELSNKELIELHRLVKEYTTFLENEKNKLGELTNERKNSKSNR